MTEIIFPETFSTRARYLQHRHINDHHTSVNQIPIISTPHYMTHSTQSEEDIPDDKKSVQWRRYKLRIHSHKTFAITYKTHIQLTLALISPDPVLAFVTVIT